MSDAGDILRKARAVIENPEAWGKGYFAVRRGDIICRCADGALLAAARTGPLLVSRASLFLSLAAQALGFETASRLNDHPRTMHADVLALFDLAIRLAEAPEA